MGCGVHGKRMVRKSRAWRDEASHIACQIELFIRGCCEPRQRVMSKFPKTGMLNATSQPCLRVIR
jgi:hypothetical protein